MSSSGVTERVHRLQGPGGRCLLVALDHGLPAGPLPGIEDPARFLRALRRAPVTGLIANPGLVRRLPREVLPSKGLVVHLSAGTVLGADPTSKVLAARPEDAADLGADAVSVQVHFGSDHEDVMLASAGRVADDARALGLPVLVMAYPMGREGAPPESAVVAHAARAAAEIGGSLVQVPFPADPEAFATVPRGCPAPVLLAGGPRVASEEPFLRALEAVIEGGAAGVSLGRNLFQHPDPAAFARRIADVIGSAVTRAAVEA